MNVRYVFIRRVRNLEEGVLYAHTIVDTTNGWYDSKSVSGSTVWICYEDGTLYPHGYMWRPGSGTSDLCDLFPLVEL